MQREGALGGGTHITLTPGGRDRGDNGHLFVKLCTNETCAMVRTRKRRIRGDLGQNISKTFYTEKNIQCVECNCS